MTAQLHTTGQVEPLAEAKGYGPIVMACDAGYAMPLATTLRSLAETNSAANEVYVLCEGFTSELRQRVEESLPQGSIELHWVEADLTLFGEFGTGEHISKMTYARFLIQHIIRSGVRRVLYLDVDLLILKNLDAVWNVDLDGAVLAAVEDWLLPELKTRWTQSEPIPSVASYFNAGVLLIDMERWREEQISEKAVAYLRQFPKTPFSDQDALNVVCDGRWKKLDAEWNQQNHFGTSLAETPADDRPRVVHFITGSKPWNTSQYHPSAAFYDQYRQRTRFARSLSERVRDAVRGAWPTTRALLRGNAVVRKIKARSL